MLVLKRWLLPLVAPAALSAELRAQVVDSTLDRALDRATFVLVATVRQLILPDSAQPRRSARITIDAAIRVPRSVGSIIHDTAIVFLTHDTASVATGRSYVLYAVGLAAD